MSPKSDRLVRGASLGASAGLTVMIVVTLIYIGWPRISTAIGAKSAAVYSAGDAVDVPAEWYAHSPHTLIVFARASCAACEKAQPFLKEVVARMNGRGGVVMAHPPGDAESDRRFARSLGITDGHIFVATSDMRVRATPTMVLVDQKGKVIGAWEGAGKAERQAAILKAVDTAVRWF